MQSRLGFTRAMWIVVTVAVAFAVGVVLWGPALATGPEGVTTFSGSTASAIVTSTNTGAGFAMIGASHNNWGVVGQTFATPTPPAGHPQFALAGVVGMDLATPAGVGYNAGVAGTSTKGKGVVGLSSTQAGVAGFSGSADGVVGIAYGANGHGVSGFSTTGPAGIYGNSSAQVGALGQTGTGVGVIGFAAAIPSGWGVEGSSPTSIGVLARSSATLNPADNFHTAALAVLGSGGAPLVIARGSAGTDVMSLDNSGNMILKGKLTQSGTPLILQHTMLGREVVTYAGHQSVPSIEDFGEAQLVDGQAYVRLDPTFAASIDARVNYLVFITPQGPTRGLYVAQKTSTGFGVREYDGRSSLLFDYRIVAKPLGSDAPRLPFVSRPVPQVGKPDRLSPSGYVLPGLTRN